MIQSLLVGTLCWIFLTSFMQIHKRLSQKWCFIVPWKVAKITFIHIKEDLLRKYSYQPISILPLISKLLGKIICTRVYCYIQQYLNPLLCWFQLVYRTQHALLRLLQAWEKELDKWSYMGQIGWVYRKFTTTYYAISSLQNLSYMVLIALNFINYLSNWKSKEES